MRAPLELLREYVLGSNFWIIGLFFLGHHHGGHRLTVDLVQEIARRDRQSKALGRTIG